MKLDAAPLNVGGGQTVDLAFSVQLPKEAAGKRLAFRVRVAPEDGSSESFGTVLVEAAGVVPAKAAAKKATPPVKQGK